MTVPDQPTPRLTLELDLYGNSLDEIVERLRRAANDLEDDRREEVKVVSGGGYSYALTLTNPDMTPERWRQELDEWWKARHAAREGDASRDRS